MLTRLVSSLFKTMVCGNFCCLRQFWILKLFLSKNCRLSKFPKFPENILLFLQGAAEIWKFENISFIVGIAWDRSSLLTQFCAASCSICGGLLKKKKNHFCSSEYLCFFLERDEIAHHGSFLQVKGPQERAFNWDVWNSVDCLIMM